VCVLSHTQFNYEKEKREKEREPLKRSSEKEGNPAKYLDGRPSSVCLPFWWSNIKAGKDTFNINFFAF
jgi:hypothetical protein